jgi:hypothetical protein
MPEEAREGHETKFFWKIFYSPKNIFSAL